MNRKCLPEIFFILLLFSLSYTSYAQADTSFVQAAISDALLSHKNAIGLHAHLYNGKEYYLPGKPHVEGHPFLEDKVFKEGNIKYDGTWFEDVPMLYDLVQDELIIINPSSGHPQMLVRRRVESFKVHSRPFTYLQTDSTTSSGIQTGFYNLLYDGDIQLLMRHHKTLHERTSTNGMEGEYRNANRFFLLKNDVYYEVSNKSSMLRVLRDQKKPLNKFANANKLRFKKNREEALLKIAQHYDTLQD